MPTTLARLLCRLLGHEPKRCQTSGYTDGIEIVASGPVAAPMRTVAEIDYCTRCGARRLALDPTLAARPSHRYLVRWVAS